MLEPYEINRPTFIDLKDALPDYSLVKEFFKEQKLNDKKTEESSINFMEKIDFN